MSRKNIPGDVCDREPTARELAAIEREWPLIEAELALLDAQIAILAAEGRVSSLDWRRLRRAERRAARGLTAQASTGTPPSVAGEVA
jgi:hypothetical protein